MKTWIKRTLIGLAATATLLGGLAAWAHRHHSADFGWRAVSAADAAPLQGRVLERAASKLELDAAQKAKLAALAERLRETRNAMVATTADPREEFKAALAGTTLDRGRVNTLVQAQLAMAGAQSPALVDAAADFYDSLRPAQQAELREMLDRGRDHHRHGRGDDRGPAQ